MTGRRRADKLGTLLGVAMWRNVNRVVNRPYCGVCNEFIRGDGEPIKGKAYVVPALVRDPDTGAYLGSLTDYPQAHCEEHTAQALYALLYPHRAYEEA